MIEERKKARGNGASYEKPVILITDWEAADVITVSIPIEYKDTEDGAKWDTPKINKGV